MANLRYKFTVPATPLTAGGSYNLFCLAAPANQNVYIEGFGVYGQAPDAETPGRVIFQRASSQGSLDPVIVGSARPTPRVLGGPSGGSTLVPGVLDNNFGGVPQATCLSQPSTPPSSPVEIDGRYINPQIGQEAELPGEIAYGIMAGTFFVVTFIPAWSGNHSFWLLLHE